MYNSCTFIGNLTRDPEMRYLPTGTPITSFCLAVSTKYTSSGEKKTETLFIDISIFGKMAENCSKYLSKGSKALIEGRLQVQEWEKDGTKHRKNVIIARDVKFLSMKKSEESVSSGEAITPEETTDLEPF